MYFDDILYGFDVIVFNAEALLKYVQPYLLLCRVVKIYSHIEVRVKGQTLLLVYFHN